MLCIWKNWQPPGQRNLVCFQARSFPAWLITLVMSEIPSRRTATLGIWLRLETLPTHMETELASLALLSKGTFATVEGVTNGFVLWRHLVAACGQCLLLWILVELIADFAKTFAFGLVACIRLDTRQRWGISFGDLHPRNQTKLHLGMIHALVETTCMGFVPSGRWVRAPCVLSASFLNNI